MADPAELRQLAEKATPGPWGWRGHVDGTVEIRGPGRFGPFDARIVSAVRSDPCMATVSDPDDPFGPAECVLTSSACEACRAWWTDPDRDPDYLCPRADMLGTVWVNQIGHGHIVPVNEYAIREVPHRDDVIDVDHPNAQLLVAARNALPALLDVVEAARPFAQCGRYGHFIYTAEGRAPADSTNHRVYRDECADDQCRNPEHSSLDLCEYSVHDLIDALSRLEES